MDVLGIHNVRSKNMKNVIEVLKRARDKKVFINNEFEDLLLKIQLADSNLKLDWDDGAGEEWARFYNQKDGIVCMINAKIGVVFVRKEYNICYIRDSLSILEIVYVDDYSSEEWFVDLVKLKQMIPEIYWHASKEAVNAKGFSLDDLYFATI